MEQLLRAGRSAAANARELLRRLTTRSPSGVIRIPEAEELLFGLDEQNPALDPIRMATAAGDVRGALEQLAFHLRARPSSFFVHPEATRNAAEAILADHPAWAAAAIQQARQWESLQWDQLPPGPGRDHLPQDQAHFFRFAVHLAKAGLYGADTHALLSRLAEEWMEATRGEPEPRGYSSCLIAVYRGLALCWTHAYLAAQQTSPQIDIQLLRILLADARFIASRLGTSFANNHLLADGFFLWFVGTAFPEFAEAASWKEKGQELWIREFRRQTYEDGASFEHALHYHEMVCEMAVAYRLLSDKTGEAVPEWFDQRLQRMLRFHIDLAGPEAHPIPFGDAVEDPLFPLDSWEHWGSAAWRVIYAALYGEAFETSAPGDHPALEKAFWLLGGRWLEPSRAVPFERVRYYPHGGIAVMAENDARTRLTFRTGPGPSDALNPGHMHADLQSVYLTMDGLPVITASGTYTYRSNAARWPAGTPAWRHFFMSPAAHNGLCIEGDDPLARGPGDFPGKPIQSRVASRWIEGCALSWVEAQNQGSTAYSGHRRGVIHVLGEYWVVYDVVPTLPAGKNATLGLQLVPDALPFHQNPRNWSVSAEKSRLTIALSEGLHGGKVYSGSIQPTRGWVSPRYGKIQPAPQLVFPVHVTGIPVATLLLPRATGVPPRIDAVAAGTGVAFRVTIGGQTDYLFAASQDTDTQMTAWGISFTGQAAWLRFHEDGRTAARWADGVAMNAPERGLYLRARDTQGTHINVVVQDGLLSGEGEGSIVLG